MDPARHCSPVAQCFDIVKLLAEEWALAGNLQDIR